MSAVVINPAKDRYDTGRVPACHTWCVVANDEAAQREEYTALAPRWWNADDIDLLVVSWWQSDHCAVCGRLRPVLIVDHDHNTGLVRGLLCRSCNSSEGRRTLAVGPSAEAYAAYRELPPTALLHLVITYRRCKPRDVLQEECDARQGCGDRAAALKERGLSNVP